MFALNFPQLFHFQNIEWYSYSLEPFNFDLPDNELEPFDIQSDSTIYNLSPTIVFGVLIILLHLVIFLINKFLSKIKTCGKWSSTLNVTKWILDKLFWMLTFGYYIRYILEMNQFILISSINEVNTFNLSQPLKIVSFIFAIMILVACLALIIFISYLSCTSYEVSKSSHNKLGELFSGIKMQKRFKSYVVIMLIRRALFVSLLITLESYQSRIVIGVISTIQLS